jgi:hypothetical protein
MRKATKSPLRFASVCFPLLDLVQHSFLELLLQWPASNACGLGHIVPRGNHSQPTIVR